MPKNKSYHQDSTPIKFDKSVDIGPQEYENMSPLQANLIHKNRVDAQIKSRKKKGY